MNPALLSGIPLAKKPSLPITNPGDNTPKTVAKYNKDLAEFGDTAKKTAPSVSDLLTKMHTQFTGVLA